MTQKPDLKWTKYADNTCGRVKADCVWISGEFRIFVYSPTIYQLHNQYAFVSNFETLEAAQERANNLNRIA